jgi:hypothetical protein
LASLLLLLLLCFNDYILQGGLARIRSNLASRVKKGPLHFHKLQDYAAEHMYLHVESVTFCRDSALGMLLQLKLTAGWHGAHPLQPC